MATPLKKQPRPASQACGREREPRPWTLESYSGLTESLVNKYGIDAVRCAAFEGLAIDPGAMVRELLDKIEVVSEEEPPSIWLRGILAALLVIYGYVRKISASRLYRFVLKRFILFALLTAALEAVLTKLVDLLEWLILHTEALQELERLLTCGEEIDG